MQAAAKIAYHLLLWLNFFLVFGVLIKPLRRVAILRPIFKELLPLYGYLLLAELVCQAVAFDRVPAGDLFVKGCAVMVWTLFPWRDDDDDDRWKRRLKALQDRVTQTGGKLIVVTGKA